MESPTHHHTTSLSSPPQHTTPLNAAPCHGSKPGENAIDAEPLHNNFLLQLKEKGNRRRRRRRSAIEDDDEEEDTNFLLQKNKNVLKADNNLVFSSGSSRKSVPDESSLDDPKKPLFQYESSKDNDGDGVP
ncbi:hypothetical protein Droror1_Dr00015581 [Drosera rotundifolia]